MKVKAFIGAIETETLGFRFGKPWRYSKSYISCVVPILSTKEKEKNYIVLPEAKEVEIVDIGKIGKVLIKNKENLPLFLRIGELLTGKTQERSLTISMVVMPNTEKEVEVKCSYSSKPITKGASFRYGGYAPRKDAIFAATSFSGQRIDQHRTWLDDAAYYREVNNLTNISTSIIDKDDLLSTRKYAEDTFKKVLKEVPLFDKQVGMAIIDADGLNCLDCFNLHAPWKAVKEAITGKEVLSIVQEDKTGIFEYKPSKAKQIVKQVLQQGFEDRIIYEDNFTKTIVLNYKDYVGEAVTLNDSTIHLMLAKKK